MPAPTYVRSGVSAGTTATTLYTAPAARVLVGKVYAAAAAACTVTLTIAGTPIAQALALNGGEVYTETALIIRPGEALAATSNTPGAVVVTVTGEEVDA
jgi:hypothetical protein